MSDIDKDIEKILFKFKMQNYIEERKNEYLKESLDSKEYEDINRRIDLQTKKINMNEKLQSQYMAKNGCQSDSLYREHDKLCDEMDELLKKRHEIAHREF